MLDTSVRLFIGHVCASRCKVDEAGRTPPQYHYQLDMCRRIEDRVVVADRLEYLKLRLYGVITYVKLNADHSDLDPLIYIEIIVNRLKEGSPAGDLRELVGTAIELTGTLREEGGKMWSSAEADVLDDRPSRKHRRYVECHRQAWDILCLKYDAEYDALRMFEIQHLYKQQYFRHVYADMGPSTQVGILRNLLKLGADGDYTDGSSTIPQSPSGSSRADSGVFDSQDSDIGAGCVSQVPASIPSPSPRLPAPKLSTTKRKKSDPPSVSVDLRNSNGSASHDGLTVKRPKHPAEAATTPKSQCRERPVPAPAPAPAALGDAPPISIPVVGSAQSGSWPLPLRTGNTFESYDSDSDDCLEGVDLKDLECTLANIENQ
ncbi:hypothetical protein EV182_001193 [Spiromyces aspiralis]|uniref:Uncharacterized protein n=1 Tax=Spiromyces aspiralis TaxID=68401 RepID=A0ACC1HX07_9FUNG|nr:hypothetical protein EV182_001193 [Spiromyces aspiralis]